MDVRPDAIRIQPAEGGTFGVDVVFRGTHAPDRAQAVARRLAERGVRTTSGRRDGGWAVAFGPITPTAMVLACPGVVW
jgi:hypothetical protein